ncbi:MAG: cytochrome P450 [Actinomycetota bacterium]|nr:cytochrome P450 [Actinomycetota bacterium]
MTALVDLSDGASFSSGFPHEMFTWLRANDPVHWHHPTSRTPDGEGFWVVSRHTDVGSVQRDATAFSSETGNGIRQGGGTGIKDEPQVGVMLNMTDDPRHHRLRSLVNRGFTPRAIGDLEAELLRRANLLLDAVGDDAFDAVHGFARELPSQAICIVLGVPEKDRPPLLDWLDAGIEADGGAIVAPQATRRLREYARGLIADKRRSPDGGIMSTIVHAVGDDGSRLSDRELVAFFALLFPAGAETTRSAIAGAVSAFVDHPEQFVRLREDPSLLNTAAEEIVRWTTPSVYKRRTASTDTEIAGVPVSAGDKVTFWEMSANRDEDVFGNPFEFDVGRNPNPHLGFGWGIHFCLGAALARLELKVALEALIERYEVLLTAGDAEWTPNNRWFGLKRLPVRAIRARTPM